MRAILTSVALALLCCSVASPVSAESMCYWNPLGGYTCLAPDNDEPPAATEAVRGSSFTTTNMGATWSNSDWCRDVFPAMSGTVWYVLDVPAQATPERFYVNTVGSTVDTFVGIYQPATGFAPLACFNDDEALAGQHVQDYPDGLTGKETRFALSTSPTYSSRYYFQVGSVDGEDGIIVFNVDHEPTQPAVVPGTGSPDDSPLCFDHNPGALTNLCLYLVGGSVRNVPVPGPGGEPTTVCVLGPICVDGPGIASDDTDLSFVWVGGYVEATGVCSEAPAVESLLATFGLDCRVDVPALPAVHVVPPV